MHTPCARLPITGPRLGPRRRSGTGYRAPGARYPGPGPGYLNARPETQAECLDHAPKCSVENLMGVGMPSTHGEEPSEFPLEDRSDRLGDPPSTVFPAGEVTGPTAPVGGPGPSGTTPRGRDDALDTPLLPKPSIVGIDQPTPDGSMTHRLLNQRRKQPRRAPGAGSNPLGTDGLGPDPHDHRQHQEPPRWTPHGVVAGRASGKARLPPSGTPPEQPQGRRQGRLPQRGGHPMPHEPVERRTPSPKRPSARQSWPTSPPVPHSPAANTPSPTGTPTTADGRSGRASRANFSSFGRSLPTPPLRDPHYCSCHSTIS